MARSLWGTECNVYYVRMYVCMYIMYSIVCTVCIYVCMGALDIDRFR